MRSFLLFLLPALPALAAPVDLLRVELHAPGKVQHVRDRDLDGDGTAELLATVKAGPDAAPERKLAIWTFTAQGPAPEPLQVLPLPADVAVLDTCDVTPAPGLEVLALSERGVLVFEHRAPTVYAAEPRLLLNIPYLAPGDTEDVPLVDLCRAPRGAAGMELWIPSERGVLVARPGPEGLTLEETLSLRPLARHVSGDEFRGPRARKDFSLLTTFIYPELVPLDADGDGDDDLYATVEDMVWLFERKDGHLSPEPRWKRTLGLRNTDAAKQSAVMEVHLGDLDGDGKPDAVATRLAGGIIRLQTETRFYQGRGLDPFPEEPSAVRKLDGYATPLPPQDLDGDGRLEMLEPTVDTAPMSVVGMMVKQRIDVDVRLLKVEQGKFKPSRAVGITFNVDTSSMGGTKGGMPLSGQDVDGDGRKDIVNLGRGDRIELWRGTGTEMPFEGEAAWSARVPSSLRAAWYVPRPGAPASIVSFFPTVKASQETLVVFWNRGRKAP